jgi:hypothetical protein
MRSCIIQKQQNLSLLSSHFFFVKSNELFSHDSGLLIPAPVDWEDKGNTESKQDYA